MNILLNESLPRRLKNDLPGHQVTTVPEMGWAGKSNGELLGLAARQFDVFITADQNLEYQQRISVSGVVVIVLAAHSNRYPDLKPLMPQVLETLAAEPPVGILVRITASS